MKSFRKVAVLGAGVMGAQIAAHCANAEVPVILFDLAGKNSPNEVVDKALAGLKKLQPAPLGTAATLAAIEVGNYDQDLAKLMECDLIIEAIAEKMEWKQALYKKIAPHIHADTVIASNTSGLSINTLAEQLQADQRPRFCGIHFFNPPRYMALVEIIPAKATEPELINRLEAWVTTRLGKNVVRAKDTPNFIANRVGLFSLLAVMHHTTRLGLGFDEVDAITGPLIGRPKSATYRTCDVVGLDTMLHVVGTMQANLKDDPWAKYYQAPLWLSTIVGMGALGQKTRSGIFRKVGKVIEVIDIKKQSYRPAEGVAAPEVVAILKEKDAAKRFMALRASAHPQAQLLWSIFRDIFHYSAYWLEDIAESAREIDQAMRWGFGWSEGPFETWQKAGWAAITQTIEEDINAGVSMSNAPLPAWVKSQNGVHQAEGSWSAAKKALSPRHVLPVYDRQLAASRLYGEGQMANSATMGKTIFDNAGLRLWEHPMQPKVAIASFQSKMHSMGAEVVEGLNEAVSRAERDYQGLVIWHEAPFAVGANLKMVADEVGSGNVDKLRMMTAAFQNTMMRIKYASVPVVAAAQGMALGGGCELLMHAARRVLAFESYIGLVEAGVGLIPAGGGSKEFAMRAAYLADRTQGKDVFSFIEPCFINLAQAKVSASAADAKALGFMREHDLLVAHADELLYVALTQAMSMAQSGYRAPYPAPLRRKIPVAGRAGIANCEMMLVNMQAGGMISAHDYKVSKAIATALCGGEIEAGTLVDEQWLLEVEREQFVGLLQTSETVARIRHMLETGKPLRN